MDGLGNYLANNYVETNNKAINKCIASAVKGKTDCNLEPVDNYLDINEKMFKQISVYKKSHEKLKQVMNKLYTCPLVTGAEKESFKDGFSKLAEPGSEIRFITLLLKYVELIRKEHKIYKDKFISLKKQTFRGPRMNGGVFKTPDEKYLLGVIISPLKDQHKKIYPSLGGLKYAKKAVGIVRTKALNTGDFLYGISIRGKNVNFMKGDHEKYEMSIGDKQTRYYFPVDGQKNEPEQPEIKIRSGLSKPIETFINLSKKSNGAAYVIFFILALVLFLKLKK